MAIKDHQSAFIKCIQQRIWCWYCNLRQNDTEQVSKQVLLPRTINRKVNGFTKPVMIQTNTGAHMKFALIDLNGYSWL